MRNTHRRRKNSGRSSVPPGVDFSGPLILGALQRCDLMRNGLGPIEGHCKWCDRTLETRND